MHLKEEEYHKVEKKATVKEVIADSLHTESELSWDVNGPIPKERKDEEFKSAKKPKIVENYPEHPHANIPTYQNAVLKDITPNGLKNSKMDKSPLKQYSNKGKGLREIDY